MKMTYKEYAKSRLEKALKDENFNESGNSITAVANRGMLKQMKLDVKRLFTGLIDIDLKEIGINILSLILAILTPVIFIPLLFSRAYFTRKRAYREMLHEYQMKILDDELSL